MGAIGKLAIGLLLVIASGWWILRAKALPYYLENYFGITVEQGTARADFLTVLNGALPPLILLIGVFIVWLEYDEWKIERELAKAEKKRRRRRRRR